jgi:hypothetical protein
MAVHRHTGKRGGKEGGIRQSLKNIPLTFGKRRIMLLDMETFRCKMMSGQNAGCYARQLFIEE